MNVERLSLILASIPYQAAMGYGLACIASFWAMPADAGRKIPDWKLMLFGLAIPLAGWIMSLFSPWAGFMVPGSLAFLSLSASSGDDADAKARASVWDEELARAADMLAADPDNAAAYWTQAQVYEQQGRLLEAHDAYRRAHELSERMLPEKEWDEIRYRLEGLMERPAAGEKRGRRSLVEKALLVVGLLYLPMSWVFTLNLCSVLAFVIWYRGE